MGTRRLAPNTLFVPSMFMLMFMLLLLDVVYFV